MPLYALGYCFLQNQWTLCNKMFFIKWLCDNRLMYETIRFGSRELLSSNKNIFLFLIATFKFKNVILMRRVFGIV